MSGETTLRDPAWADLDLEDLDAVATWISPAGGISRPYAEFVASLIGHAYRRGQQTPDWGERREGWWPTEPGWYAVELREGEDSVPVRFGESPYSQDGEPLVAWVDGSDELDQEDLAARAIYSRPIALPGAGE